MIISKKIADRYITEQLRCEFRTVPGAGQFAPINTTGIAVWTPPVRALIKGLVAVVDLGDPLVAAGGAATMALGNLTNGTLAATVFGVAQATAVWNTAGGRGIGWDAQIAQAANIFEPPPPLDGGAAMWGTDLLWPGIASGTRFLAASSNAGTYTGTVLITLQWRPYR